MKGATPFVILFPGRTGSSWLVSLLDSHPGVVARGEELVRRSARSQPRWIRRLYRHGGDRRALARGFKTKLKDVWDIEGFRSLLEEHDARVIVMSRRNKVKLALSTINARRLWSVTERWNRRRGDAPLPPLEVAPDELRRVLEECRCREEQLDGFAETLALPRMGLEYEDLLAAPLERAGDVLSFLDVPAAPLTSDVVKNTDDDLRRAITNYEPLRAAFADGPYASMF